MDVHALPIQWLKCDEMGRWETWPLILFWRCDPNSAAVENRIKDERLWYGRPRSVSGVTFQPATKKRHPWQLAGVRTSLCSAEIRNISLNWPFCVGQVSEWHLWFIKFNPLCLCWCWKKKTSAMGWAMWKLDYQNICYITCILTVKWQCERQRKKNLQRSIESVFYFMSVFLKKKKKNSESKPLPASQHPITAVQIWSRLSQFKFFKVALTLQCACKYLKGEITRLCSHQLSKYITGNKHNYAARA